MNFYDQRFIVRRAETSDATELLGLMHELADFEKYREHFLVTETDLVRMGLGDGASDFVAYLCCTEEGKIEAYAVIVEIKFTFDLRPNWYLKEFFVRPEARRQGVGAHLFEALKAQARASGVGRLKWDVLPDTRSAQAFYRHHQGELETAWQAWILRF
ncbi:GNAT family N-acetyltransferase [Undibacterium cyanobacteriorum]|uniref:GNAT family N-acetyltransferase n=1 Tax=Undibacterium cyanobacteriorum TaxID=3073561 RepID=A0ABY9RFN6_9BURK|nr:GNAT family N-acetyltransferase [Undibacterium sp. 20NA77.5]WMW79669.1 GNAT family N-acetyltransferase [Undibacterium sp. 20NA77.5]